MPYFSGQINTNIHGGVGIVSNKIDKLSGIHKFGYNDTISNARETVWEGGGIYSEYPSSGVALELQSSIAGDTDDGVEITIEGLDYDYLPLTETVTLDDQGNALTDSGAFIRVNRAYVSGSQAASGNINIFEEGDSGNQYAYIDNVYQQTQMAVYCVPAGKTAYMVKLETGHSKAGEYEINIMVREPGKVFRCLGVMTSHGQTLDRAFEMPLMIPEKSDIRIDAKCQSTGGVTAAFDLILEDE